MRVLPKISCLLVTAKGRFEYAKRSIQCYLDQTYSNRELVVINEGPKEYQNELQTYIETLQRPDIRFVWLKGFYTLGALRNIAMAMATGEYICQWDDDDYCMPHRLAAQFSYMSRFSEAKVCYLADQLQYFFLSNELYWNDWKVHASAGQKKYSLIPGTIMAKQNLGVRYPHTRAGEDSVLSDALIDKDFDAVILMHGFGNMHVYTHHGKNVYNFDHHDLISKCRGHEREHMIRNRELITQSLFYWNFNSEVKVMGRDGLAFIYRRHDVS